MNRIEQNEKLREEIVELADIWDGKESGKYGKSLQGILDKLGINDIPYFWTPAGLQEMADLVKTICTECGKDGIECKCEQNSDIVKSHEVENNNE
jgi:hypothetical protein